MKSIKINRLVLENFKCHRNLVLEPGGNNFRIYGDNASGKTSIYDGLTWLLFGKDSAGNGEKIIGVKPLSRSGEVADHLAVTAVECEFSVDGTPVCFRKTCREIWKKDCFEGNGYDYFVNGVPMRRGTYEQKIRELVPEEVFRLLTSVTFFAGEMKWQERRAILFDMAGRFSDRELMEREVRFQPLVQEIGSLSLCDFKAKLLCEKKGLVGVRDDLPARISECQHTLDSLGSEDEEEIQRRLEALNARREAISGKLSLPDLGLEETTLALREAKLERKELENRQAFLRENQRRTDALRTEIAGIRREAEACRAEWIRRNAEDFDRGVCPTCGQTLPLNQLKSAMERFAQQKQKALRSIEEKEEGLRIKEEKMKNELENAEKSMAAMPDFSGVDARISALEASLKQGTLTREGSLRQELEQVEMSIHSAQKELAKAALRQQTRQRMDQLRLQARRNEEALAALDGWLEMAEEFIRFKAGFAEKCVNSLFRLARFKLFRECINGSLEERCDVVYRGVPYLGLNRGARVNIGIDIINTLSRYYGVSVPLFVDNAEGVTRLEDCTAQVIRLLVREEDKILRAEIA